jgi:hypothetical protein
LIFVSSCTVNARRVEPISPWLTDTPAYVQTTRRFDMPRADQPVGGQSGMQRYVDVAERSDTQTTNQAVGDQSGMQTYAEATGMPPDEAVTTPSDESVAAVTEIPLQPIPLPLQPKISSETHVYSYYPDEEVYWNQSTGDYVVYQNAAWVTTRCWPIHISRPQFYVALGINVWQPWRRHHFYRGRYPHGYCHRTHTFQTTHPVRVEPSYRNHRQRSVSIRTSRHAPSVRVEPSYRNHRQRGVNTRTSRHAPSVRVESSHRNHRQRDVSNRTSRHAPSVRVESSHRNHRQRDVSNRTSRHAPSVRVESSHRNHRQRDVSNRTSRYDKR